MKETNGTMLDDQYILYTHKEVCETKNLIDTQNKLIEAYKYVINEIGGLSALQKFISGDEINITKKDTLETAMSKLVKYLNKKKRS